MTSELNCDFVSSHGLLKSCDIYRVNSFLMKDNDNEILSRIETGNTLYVCNSNIQIFTINLLPRITKKVILVSGDDDQSIPHSYPDSTRLILESPYIVHWFSQNCTMSHPKITHLPIGLDYHTMSRRNTFWGDIITPIEQENEIKELIKLGKSFGERNIRIYSTFHFELGRGDRAEAYNGIPKDLIDYPENKTTRLVSHKRQLDYAFVASPFGCGPDCHRTWEALVLGCIPIIKSSGLNDLFKDLPVLIVDKWTDVTHELLSQTVEKFKTMKFNYDKLRLSYWVNLINSYKIF